MSSQTVVPALGAAAAHRPYAVEATIAPSPSVVSTLQIGLGTNGIVTGGAERVFAELAACLPDYNVNFCGAVAFRTAQLGAGGAIRHGFAPSGAKIGARLIGARRLLLQLLREQPFNLVASHFALYSFPILDILRKRPFVVHFHGPWSAESQEEGSGRAGVFAKHQLEKLVYRRADRVIALSRAFAHLVQREYGVPEELIDVVPGSVDIERFHNRGSKADARLQLGWPTDRTILLSVRRLTRRVGLDLLIEAMPRIVAKFPDVLLCIGGKGHQRETLQQQVDALNLRRHVRFLGFVSEEELPLAYRAADFNVVPTRACEGFGLVAAEALASGTPSLVTPIGGLPEVVGPLSPELVFRSATSDDIAEGILQALGRTIFVPTSDACRNYAEEHFSSSLMAARTAAVYRRTI